MDPYYRTFPHQKEPNSFSCQYNPGWGVMPSQMKTDPFRHPSVFVPPNDNICHSYTGDHSGHCHHSCPPSYYSLRPQFPHVQSPPHLYCCGPYPPCPDAYPAYLIPPPHYTVDQARYDYDKAQNHCCGCPNHTCHRRDDSSPMIEERKPENVQDRDASNLIRLPNYHPSPVVWVPSSSIKGGEDGMASQLQPGCWNGWVPSDINSLMGSRHEFEGKENQQNEDTRVQRQSTFPIIWMPGYDMSEEAGKELKECTPKSVNGLPSKVKIVPLKFIENGDPGERPKAAQEEPDSQIHPEAAVEKESEKESEIKTIPVTKMEERTQKKVSTLKQEEEADDKKAASCVRQTEESEVSKASEKKQSSPGRSSKLPPVCLRVDPLPRKKTSNGTSRSPSSPCLKEKRNHQDSEEKSPRKESRDEISDKVKPILDVKDGSSRQEEKRQKFQKNVPVTCSEESSMESLSQEATKRENGLKAQDLIEGSEHGGKKDSEGNKSIEAECEQKIVVDNGRAKSSKNKEVKGREGSKRDLSETDAAVIIQSAYRGFEVRRWQPLQKLQKIAKIREQASRIRVHVQSIEASPEALDGKQRMVIGETIMNLLLQLDTIQGLHPSVKEVRKTVAKELVSMQEKLDSLGSHIAKEHKPDKVEEETKAMDGEAAFVSSSTAILEQESCQENLDSMGSRIDEEHEPANVEEETKATGGEAAFVSSSSDTLEQESFRRDVLEDKNNSFCNVAKPGELDVKIIDLPAGDKVALVPSPSSQGEASPMPASMQPTENKVYIKELDRPDSESGAASQAIPSETASEEDKKLTVVTEPVSGQGVVLPKEEPASEQWTTMSLVTEPASGEGVGQSAKQYRTSESLSTESQESDSKDRRHEDMTGGEANEAESDASSNTPLLEISYEEHEAVPIDHKVEEDANVHYKMEMPHTRSLEEETNLGEITCAKIEVVKMPLDVEPVVCIADENRSQPEAVLSLEQKGDEQNVLEDLSTLPVVDAGSDTSVQSVDKDTTCSEDIPSPKLDLEIDNVNERVSENIEVPVTENGICSAGETNEENRLNVSVEEIGDPTRDTLPADEDATSDGGYTLVEGSGSCGLDRNGASYSLLEGMSKKSKSPDQSSALVSTASTDTNKEKRKLPEENEKLREILEELLEAGKEQLGAISNLNQRVKDLERKLAQQQKKKKSAKVKVNRPHKLQS